MIPLNIKVLHFSDINCSTLTAGVFVFHCHKLRVESRPVTAVPVCIPANAIVFGRQCTVVYLVYLTTDKLYIINSTVVIPEEM